MIYFYLECDTLDNDIRSLFMAFYPGRAIKRVETPTYECAEGELFLRVFISSSAQNSAQNSEANNAKNRAETKMTMELTQDAAEQMGMKPYYLYRQKNMTGNMENVGYAKPGKEGIYNILIMEELQSIVALGAGAITKVVYPNGRIERCENVKDIKTYLEKTDEMIERKKKLFADLSGENS